MSAEDLTLAEAVEQIIYGADCRTCKTGTRRIDLYKMLERLGPNALVREIRPHLRCSRCGTKNVINVTYWISATITERMSEHWVDSEPG
jgi:hypothetical protein